MNSENETTNQVPTNGGSVISLAPDAVLTPEASPEKSISYGEVMASAWNIFTKNLLKFFSFLLIPYIVPLVALIPIICAYFYMSAHVELQQEIISGQIPHSAAEKGQKCL